MCRQTVWQVGVVRDCDIIPDVGLGIRFGVCIDVEFEVILDRGCVMWGCCRWMPWTLALLAAAGCAGIPSSEARTAVASHIAAGAGMQPVVEASGGFPLHGFARLACQGDALHVFIEGDGLAWLDISTPSPDPTPVNPVGLQLAAGDRACNVLYLGRPGQYAGGAVDSRYWRGARFAPEVVDSYVSALRRQAVLWHTDRIRLTGYSGGGAIAALVAPAGTTNALVSITINALNETIYVDHFAFGP